MKKKYYPAGKKPALWLAAAGFIGAVLILAQPLTVLAESVPALDSAVSEASAGPTFEVNNLWDVPPDGSWPALADINAQAWIVYDRQTDQIILENNIDEVLFPASITKIMTAVIALETGDLDRQVTVSPAAVNLTSGSSKVGFLAGETVVLRDVLAGMMVTSGNDAANVVAETLAGSNEQFAVLMNAKAAKLGMTNSHFCNPSGLQDYSHVVTARDMAALTDYALSIPEFRALVSIKCYAMPATNLHPYLGWGLFYNTNRLLLFGETAFRSDYISRYTGVKTGSTDIAGSNLVSSAITTNGHELISVLLGVQSNNKYCTTFNYSRTLLDEAARMVVGGRVPTADSQASGSDTQAGGLETDGSGTNDPENLNNESTTTSAAAADPADSPDDGKEGGLSGGSGIGHFLTDNLWRTAVLGFLLWLVCWFVWRWRKAKLRRRRRVIRSLPVKPRRIDAP